MLSVGIAAPAHAVGSGEVREGTLVSGPGASCNDTADNADNSYVKVCFEPDGDYLYVRDDEQDGRSAYGRFDSGWEPGRDACRNKHGIGTWVRCNYDITEGRPAKFQGFTQDNAGWLNPERNHTAWAYDMNVNGQN